MHARKNRLIKRCKSNIEKRLRHHFLIRFLERAFLRRPPEPFPPPLRPLSMEDITLNAEFLSALLRFRPPCFLCLIFKRRFFPGLAIWVFAMKLFSSGLYFGPEGFCWMNTGSGCIPWFMYLGGAILIYLLCGIIGCWMYCTAII